MKLERLSLTHCGGFEQLDISFEPEVTLIAGINGAGKSTLLRALAVVLSRALPEFTPSRSTPIHFTDDDIHGNATSLEVWARLRLGEQSFNAGIQRLRAGANESDRFILLRQERSTTEATRFVEALRARTLTGDLEAGMKETRSALSELKRSKNPPLAVYFTPKRQLPGQPRSLPAIKPFDPSIAYGRALHDREVELREFMHWFRTQQALGTRKQPRRLKVLDALSSVVTQLVPEFTDLRIEEEPRLGFVVNKQGQPFFLHQLSDGERGLLALIFDLTRRLAIANPDSDNPIAEGEALVMIDEIELHLHPKWQRHIVRKLRDIFKSCQFVITTHSPQVIGQVDATQLRLLTQVNGKITVANSRQALGMDSNWVLQNIMGTSARDYATEQQLSKIYSSIDNEKYAEARRIAGQLRSEIGDFPDLQEAIALLDRIDLLKKK